MCGRYAIVQAGSVAERFEASEAQQPLLPRFNVAPSQANPVVVRNSPNRVVLMQWGLVPAWSKEPRTQFSTINARAETVATSSVFRGPFKSRRCLVPASAFYEWKKTSDGKQPFCIRLRGGELFAFAGLYDIWRDGDGNELQSYTIITTAANELVAPLHNRMPVILHRDDESAWLDKSTEPERLQALLTSFPADAMETFPVSRALNSPANEGAELMEPVAA